MYRVLVPRVWELRAAEYPGLARHCSVVRGHGLVGRRPGAGVGRDFVNRKIVKPEGQVVARGGVEPPTFRFSVGRSYQLSYLAGCTPPHSRSAKRVHTVPEQTAGSENRTRRSWGFRLR